MGLNIDHGMFCTDLLRSNLNHWPRTAALKVFKGRNSNSDCEQELLKHLDLSRSLDHRQMVFFPVVVGFDNKALVPWCAMEMGGSTMASLVLDGEMPKSTVIHSMVLQLREGLKILHEAGGLIRVSVSCYLV